MRIGFDGYDWAWASAYQQHGLAYYPKALVAAPSLVPRLTAAPYSLPISVDLRGLKAALLERSRAQGQTPSDFVRALLAAAPTNRWLMLWRHGNNGRLPR